MPPSFTMSNHTVNIVAECYKHCTKEEKCFGFNYRAKESNGNRVNCQLSNSTEMWNRTETGEWVHYQDVRVSKLSQFIANIILQPQITKVFELLVHPNDSKILLTYQIRLLPWLHQNESENLAKE